MRAPWQALRPVGCRGLQANRKACFRRDGKSPLAALGEFTSRYGGQGATFRQAVLHRCDDRIGKRNLRIGRREMRIGRRQTMNLRGLRLASDPGFEYIELMLEVRE